MVKITFPDGTKKEFDKGVTGLDVAKSISEGLARAAVAVKINDTLVDVSTVIEEDSTVQIITFKDPEGVEVFRHSTAHVMVMAVVSLFPDAKPTIGPAIEEGFYYDFEHAPFKPDDLKTIEAKMKEIVKSRLPFERKVVSKKEALSMFKDNKFKVEMINEMEGELTVYSLGDFVDLCKGPHVQHSGKIESFKLLKTSAAYWKGDAKRETLQRIYGISYPEKKQLKEYLQMVEEALKRDHRKISKTMDLFSMHEEGPGFPFFHPNGMIIWNELLKFWREEHRKAGYEEIKTPIMLNRMLWEKSGHWDNYKEHMYTTKIDKQDFVIKPMNCPGGMLIYKETTHSYRELPMRIGEIGLVHRHELAGVLSGLFRVRAFHQDDAHIFMTEAQIKDEIIGVLELAKKFYKVFGLEYHLELSTRPEKSIGTDEQWETATTGLKNALDSFGEEYKTNEGDGAFYGPKVDMHIKDCIGRTWQCGTIQLDMSLPERFDLTYEGSDGKKHRPVMIHRVIYGSIERFMGIIIENYAGKFPLWLSPEQVRILTIADRHNEYAEKVKQKLFDARIRVSVDDRSLTMNKKIREAEVEHVNYILVVGDKEIESEVVNVRTRENEVKGEVKVDEFLKQLKKEIEEKK